MLVPKKGSFFALLPLLIFVVTYLTTSLILNDFYKLPILVALLFSAVVGLLQYPKLPFTSKMDEFSKGAGNPGIMFMILIFLLAGAFAELSKATGAVQSTIYFCAVISATKLTDCRFVSGCMLCFAFAGNIGRYHCCISTNSCWPERNSYGNISR
jgi:Na+/H+ antiporter NhaC